MVTRGRVPVGDVVARHLAAAGHNVLIFDRKPRSAAKAAAEAADGQPGKVSAADVDQVLTAEIVVIALWYPGSVNFVKAHTAALTGKIVVDIANPLDETSTRLSVEPTTSVGEELAKALPDSLVVKAINTQPAPVLFAGEVGGETLDTCVASDNAAAKAAVLGLLLGSGLRGIDAGKLETHGCWNVCAPSASSSRTTTAPAVSRSSSCPPVSWQSRRDGRRRRRAQPEI